MTRKHVRPHLDIEVREEEDNECVISLSPSLSPPPSLPLSPPQGVLAPITDLHYNYHTGDNQNTDTKGDNNNNNNNEVCYSLLL